MFKKQDERTGSIAEYAISIPQPPCLSPPILKHQNLREIKEHNKEIIQKMEDTQLNDQIVERVVDLVEIVDLTDSDEECKLPYQVESRSTLPPILRHTSSPSSEAEESEGNNRRVTRSMMKNSKPFSQEEPELDSPPDEKQLSLETSFEEPQS